MNEKIKQLAKQASVTPSYSSDGFLPRYLFEEEELAKFAELIVRECAMFSMVITDDHYDVDALYRHFGVEE